MSGERNLLASTLKKIMKQEGTLFIRCKYKHLSSLNIKFN